MTMELEPTRGGHWLFTLGAVEKWVVTSGAAMLLACGYWFTSSVTSRLDAQSMALASLATQQAVTNAQLVTLTASLADVPDLSRRVSQNDIKIESLQDSVKELRAVRGLK